MEEVGQLHAELEELRQLLHESQERENLAMEQVGTARIVVEHLQDELKKLEVEHEYAQTKLELDYCQAVEWDRRECEEMEKKLLEQLAEARKESLSNTPDHGSHRSINLTPTTDNVVTINIDTVSQPHKPAFHLYYQWVIIL